MNRSSSVQEKQSPRSKRAPAKPNGGEAPAPSPQSRRRAAAEKNCATPPNMDRHQYIAEAAYYRAEKRGFAEGAALADWLAAEAEFEARIDH
jgi:hypothetical protein